MPTEHALDALALDFQNNPYHPNHPLTVSPTVAFPSSLLFCLCPIISVTSFPVSPAACAFIIMLLSSSSLSAGVIPFKRSLSAACAAGFSSVCVSGIRGGKSSFDDADADPDAVVGSGGVPTSVAVVVVVSFVVGTGVEAVDLDREGSKGANCGSGRPAALASAMAASCASMRW